jgi:ABC-type branched-subunit amino acid transport system permease subunit
MNALKLPWVKRLIACLGGGVVLAMMIGNQEGTINGDFGVAFYEALGLRSASSQAYHFPLRLFLFLLIGVAMFVLISFWNYAVPYFKRPGVVALGLGVLGVLISQGVMNWYDPIAAGKNSRFLTLKPKVDKTNGLQVLTQPFFDWLSWALLVLAVIACAFAIVLRRRVAGYAAAVAGVAGAVFAYLAHADVVSVGGGPDHSLGAYTDFLAFATIAVAGITAVHSSLETAAPREFVNRVLGWRPGLVLVVVGVILGLFAYANDAWYAPLTRNADFSKTHSLFSGTAISSVGSAYLGWLGWTLFAATAVAGVAATYLCLKPLAWATAALSVVGIILTFLTVHSITFVGFRASPNDGQPWSNVGAGGFIACFVFALFGAATIQVLMSGPRVVREPKRAWTAELPFTSAVMKIRNSAQTKALLVVGVALAVFYPPIATVTWQNVLVTQIGVYVLLAVGLNVVVGWAGLLDLGYIAFYGIGSYTTAYFTGSLPLKPPDWLHVTPLLAIPFAIAACLVAGVLLGAPTLRLRGDYLAIVTLGFGEIVEVLAVNNVGGITGGPTGPNVPHPVIRIGGWHVTWGQDNLPYWYLLLVILGIVLVLFHRLENSRLGRAWAAIREDEVAAQASGVNTVRAKLLAFAIGASTSGLAGVFFATQVGYFDPSLFTLQASILIVAYVVFGGMGSLPGAMAGAAVLTWLPQFLKGQVPTDDRQMWVGAAVLAMMIFRPAGLLPAKRRKAELEGLDSPASSEVTAVPASEGL